VAIRLLTTSVVLGIVAISFSSASSVSGSGAAKLQQIQQTAVPTRAADGSRLLLATTTSTNDSGLLAFILPDFEKQSGAKVDIVAVGSGQAFKLGEQGDADVLLVHARALEEKFVSDGFGTKRYDVMFNDFVIVGPVADPAKVKGMTDAAAALTTISKAGAKFISRGDDSGTHVKEQDLWKKAGIEPKGDWYISAGQGMGAVLNMSNEQLAYTLTDRATYVSRLKAGFDLVVLVEGDAELRNPYSVIPVNPAKHPTVNAKLAQAFADWLISVETQKLIASFKVNDQQLFFPASEPFRESLKQPSTATPDTAATPATTPAATAAR
jgi:tungstate transport system substrate-binding protein